MKALVLAGGLPQIKLIKELKGRGVETILADGNEKPIAYSYADKFYHTNIFDVELISKIAIEEKVDFLITCCADQVLLVVAQVSEMLGLPWYIDYKTAKMVSDKELMKKRFVEKGIPTSKYIVTERLENSVTDDMKYPLVVKPVDSYSSKGVRKVFNKDELKIAFDEAINISRSNKVIIEEFCEGEEISIDVFVVDGEAKVLCISNSLKIDDGERFVIFRGKYSNEIPSKLRYRIETISQQIADAFDIKNAPMLIQLISNGDDLSVLEFCARTGGAMKYILIERSCGVDVIKAVVDLTMGLEPNIIIQKPENHYIINDFIYCKPGIYHHIEGFQELVDDGIIKEYHVLRPEGFVFSGIANSSSDRIAGITINADSKKEFNEKHARIMSSIKVLDNEGNNLIRKELLPGI